MNQIKINSKGIADLFFIGFLFLLMPTLFLFGYLGYEEKNALFVFTICIWGILKTSTSKLPAYKPTIFDTLCALIVVYLLIHTISNSNISIYNSQFLVYVAYAYFFILFRWSLRTNNEWKSYLNTIIIFILSGGVIQSIIAVMQYWELLRSKNAYFKVTGSFFSPNYLGIYISLVLIVSIWHLVSNKSFNVKKLVLIIIMIVLFLSVIVMSNSRTSWIAVLSGTSVLFFTSNKSNRWLKMIPNIVKTGILFLLLVICILIGQFLYSLKPESVRGRVLITKITFDEIAKKPIYGHGLFTFAKGYNIAKAEYFMNEDRSWEEVEVASYVYTAFNDYLLLWYELGSLTLLLFIIFMIFLLSRVEINAQSRLGMALITCISVSSLFHSSINETTLVLMGLFGIGLVSINRRAIYLPYIINLKPMVIVIAVLIGLIGSSVLSRKLVSINDFKSAFKKKGKIPVEKFIELQQVLENNRNSDFRIGSLLYKYGHKEDGYVLMEKGFENTYSPKVGKSLASRYVRDGNLKRAEEIYRLNIGLEPYRYEARMNLLDILIRTNQYQKALFLCKEIIDLPVKIHSKKVEQYKIIARRKKEICIANLMPSR